MESGLEGRNNQRWVFPGRDPARNVSMESGLEGRNNVESVQLHRGRRSCLNGVRPRRPEQSRDIRLRAFLFMGLNGVRPRRPEQYTCRPSSSAPTSSGLNGVRPRRPEQCQHRGRLHDGRHDVSMESGLEGRNNAPLRGICVVRPQIVSMESGLEGRNNLQHVVPVWQRLRSLNGVRPRRPEQ